MRFFIIPKRMFKNPKEEKPDKHKVSSKKVGVILVISAILIALIFVLWRVNRVPSVSFCEGVGKFCLEAYTQEDREDFFEQFSYDAEEVSAEKITIPCTTENFEEYNEIQKSQGLDLMPYCGKSALMYTMKITPKDTNNPDENLYGVIIVYKGKVVAGHITDFLYPACIKALND